MLKKDRLSIVQRRKLITGLLFVSPWLIGFLIWTIYPLGSSIYYSLHRYDMLRPPVYLGLQNYVDIFTKDRQFGVVLYNTFYYVLLGTPTSLASAFLMAVLLNTRIAARSMFRAIFFLPSIVPAVVVAMVWQFLLNIQFGAINATLRHLGLQAIPFLSNPDYAKPSLILILIWAQGGAIVIFLATLQDVPRSLYEAATVDGANAWHRFWNVTVPMCTPVILFQLVMGFINGFQEFSLPFLMTNGGPNRSTEFFSLYLYRTAYTFLNMGKASALAWIMFIFITIFTLILFRTSARWVYYGGEQN